MQYGQLALILAALILAPTIGAFRLRSDLLRAVGHFIPLIGGIVAQLVSMIVLIAFPSPAGYVAGTLIFTVAWAIVFPYFLSIQSEMDHSGTVVAFGQFTNLVGTAIGPALAAMFVGGEGDFVGALWISVAMTILALVPMILIPAVSHREKRRA